MNHDTTTSKNLFEQGLRSYLSEEKIQKIQVPSIGIGGAGGLGSNTAVMLARCGFRKFILMDFDAIEPANLNRQYFFLEDIGKNKVDVLASRLCAINPDICCHAVCERWLPGLDDDPFQSCDILIEAFDAAETKSAFIDYYSDKVPQIISGNGMAGISGPSLSVQKHGNIVIVGDKQTGVGSEHPPMAPRVTACAAMMAEEVLMLSLK